MTKTYRVTALRRNSIADDGVIVATNDFDKALGDCRSLARYTGQTYFVMTDIDAIVLIAQGHDEWSTKSAKVAAS